MTLSIIGLLVLFSLLLASGQILFKLVARSAESLNTLPAIIGLAGNGWFWMAMVFYGTATILWIFILQKIDLVHAYPFVALGFVVVPVAAHFLLGEHITLSYFAGVALILAGLWFITTKMGA